MIHQFIFASPKPGMSEKEFQDYWVHKHAVNFASKIPQIRKYIVDTRIPKPGETQEPLFSGIAEIWIKPEEQLASLQSKEFLQGARLDEPNWAAFWKTIVVDTTETIILDSTDKSGDDGCVKIVRLLKRRAGMDLDNYRNNLLNVYAPFVKVVERLKGFMICHAVDGSYEIGEARFDSVEVFAFDDVDSANAFLESDYCIGILMPMLLQWIEMKYLFALTVKEHWIMR